MFNNQTPIDNHPLIGRTPTDGWVQLCQADGCNRRALWIRVSNEAVEFCNGREGRDGYVMIRLHDPCPLSIRDLVELRGMLDGQLWAWEMSPPT